MCRGQKKQQTNDIQRKTICIDAQVCICGVSNIQCKQMNDAYLSHALKLNQSNTHNQYERRKKSRRVKTDSRKHHAISKQIPNTSVNKVNLWLQNSTKKKIVWYTNTSRTRVTKHKKKIVKRKIKKKIQASAYVSSMLNGCFRLYFFLFYVSHPISSISICWVKNENNKKTKRKRININFISNIAQLSTETDHRR